MITPDGQVLCNDDSVTGTNINPLVTIANPSAGRYAVFVGRIDEEKPLSGTLTVVESADAQPEVLTPAAP